MRGKIIKGIAGFYYVHVPLEPVPLEQALPDGSSMLSSVYACKARGVFRSQKQKPLVGDDVEITVLEETKREGTIERLLPRRRSLIRPAVSNVDQAVVLFAAAEPEPNLHLLDRFLVYLEWQEVPAIVCFNKSDLADPAKLKELTGIYTSCGYPVYGISVKKQEGIEELHSLFSGKTTVLAGPSGVGKSSLTNLLAPEAEMETGQVSEKIKRGRHTTRHSELFALGGQSYLMDTPGFASLELSGIEKEELWQYFPEFAAYEPYCRFKGCVHIGERECGVKDAVTEGEVAGSRYQSYRLLYEEIGQQKKY